MQRSGTLYHPELGELISYDTYPLSEDPDTQVAQTIDRMRRHVRQDSESLPIRQAAGEIAASGSGDPCSDTFWWVKGKIGFQQDEQLAVPVRQFLDGDVVEVLIRPQDLLRLNRPIEDCDGFASLTPALLRVQGVPCSFVTVAADAREPGRFSHVYAACYPNGERIPLDASHGPYPGWEATQTGQVTRVKEWPIDGPDWGELVGIAVLIALAWLAARGLGWI